MGVLSEFQNKSLALEVFDGVDNDGHKTRKYRVLDRKTMKPLFEEEFLNWDTSENDPTSRLLFVEADDGLWRVIDSDSKEMLNYTFKGNRFEWGSALRAYPSDFKYLPTKYFEEDITLFIKVIKEALANRVKYMKNVPDEEFEYAKKILEMVKEKIATEKANLATHTAYEELIGGLDNIGKEEDQGE